MSTDFFQQQDSARRRTGWLIFLFTLAVLAIALAIYAVLAAILVAGNQHLGVSPHGLGLYWHPGLFAGVVLGTLGVILASSLYRIYELSGGGEKVALLLGGRPIDPQTTDLAERRLLNVVEEMALASGVPVPPVYVLDQEASINAFAAGHNPDDAVIGVSRGALEYLNRDELQGVMAHEFSHILNGDMRLDLRLAGLVFGILVLAVLGYYTLQIAARSTHGSRSSRKGGGGIVLGILAFGAALWLIGYIGVFFGKLLKAAVSRQREYLADSAAVQFTRNPGGIGGALKKIGGLPQRSRIRDAHAQEVSHMFFSDAFEGMFLNFFATHPPLVKRIQRIEPGFDGKFPVVTARITADEPATRAATEPKRVAALRQFLENPQQFIPLAAERAPVAIAGIGVPQAAAVEYAATLIAAMPKPLTNAARDPYSARALVYASLLDRNEETRQAQLNALRQQIEEPSYREMLHFASVLDSLSEEVRAPLVEMALPSLKRLSPSQYAAFRQGTETLVEADRRVDLFEYMIRAILVRALDIHFGMAKAPTARYRAVTPVLPHLVTVLSTLAHAGQSDAAEAEKAFRRGLHGIGRTMEMLPKGQCTLSALDGALQELAQAVPNVQRVVLHACVACITADRQVTVREGELLRAVAGMLGCPVPLVGQGRQGGQEDAGP